MLSCLELRIAGEQRIRLRGRLIGQRRVDIGEVDDAQLGLAALALAEELAGTADLQVALREVEAVEWHFGSIRESLALRHRRQPLRFLGLLGNEHRIRALTAAADPPAKLVKLREAKALRAEDDHHGCVRNVDADLDHGGRDEHVDLALREAQHDLVAVLAGHAPVHERDTESRELLLAQIAKRRLGARDVVVEILFDARRDDERLLALRDALA